MANNKKPARTVGNPYGIIQVNPRAEQVVFTAAYQALKKRLRGDSEQLKRLESAWRLIGDPDNRAEYDAEHRRQLDGKVVGDRYRIERFIAEGATGETYEAKYLINDETVCLKHFSKIDPGLDDLLIEEFNAMRRVRHYAFPAAYELVRLDDGCLALVMTFIQGPTMTELVKEHGALDAETVCWIAERLLNSLMYLHMDREMVHGDLKPQNIIIDEERHHAILVDFGLAVVRPTANTRNKGFTEHFAPPEMMVENNPPIPESDLYSLAMVMMYCLGGGIRAVKAKSLPRSLPNPLREFVLEMSRLEPLERPQWENRNLYQEMIDLREQCFGRTASGMKAVTGNKD